MVGQKFKAEIARLRKKTRPNHTLLTHMLSKRTEKEKHDHAQSQCGRALTQGCGLLTLRVVVHGGGHLELEVAWQVGEGRGDSGLGENVCGPLIPLLGMAACSSPKEAEKCLQQAGCLRTP